MTDERMIRTLKTLYRVLDAGEKGFAVSAANVSNRGLKVLFKSYAQQRARLKNDMHLEIQRLESDVKFGSGLLAAVHRGRINISSALTIGTDEREKIILREIMVGEKVALKAFQKAGEQEFPPETKELITGQFEQMIDVVEQIHMMTGVEGKQLVLRLFDTEHDADDAIQELKQAGLRLESIERVPFGQSIELYKGKCTAVSETILSGAMGGALWGSLVGTLSGISMELASRLAPFGVIAMQNIWAYDTLAGLFVGALIGTILGFVLGSSIANEDAYLYDQSIQRGKIILKTMVDAWRAAEAGQIMAYVNVRARSRSGKMPV